MVGIVNRDGDVLGMAIADLRGAHRGGEGRPWGAITAFTVAVTAEDQLGYHEPPEWLLPERERLGVGLLAEANAAVSVHVPV